MKLTWYFGTILFIFAYLGIFQDQVALPNQEIVLQFADDEVDHSDIKHTIDNVRGQLSKIGVTNIVIKETESGTLKISYYSAIHIDNIREALLEKSHLMIDQNSEDRQNNGSLEYKIKIFEITDNTDLSTRNDKLLFENKYHSDRFTNDQADYYAKHSNNSKANILFKLCFKSYRKYLFLKDYNSYQEPEIRAGPLTKIS